MDMVTNHSAIKSAMLGLEIREDVIVDEMMRNYMAYASHGRVTLYVPLTFVLSCANELAATTFLFVAVLAHLAVLAVQTLYAERVVSRFDRAGLLSPMHGFTFLTFLSGALWGLTMLPVNRMLGENVTAAVMSAAIFICVTVTSALQAGLRQFVRAYLAGFALFLIPQFLYRFETMGFTPLIATLVLIAMLIWIAEIIRRQSSATVRAQMENSLLADQLADALTQACYFSQRDSLTGLLNRRAFEEAAMVTKAKSGSDATHAIILIDLDHFKTINDRHGHIVGDAVLKSVAGAISQSLHPSDLVARGDGTVARWGGEEFVVLLKNCPPEQAICAAESIRLRIAAYRDENWPDALFVTGSLGVALWQGQSSLQSAISNADQAMYAAKRAGRNQTRAHSIAN